MNQLRSLARYMSLALGDDFEVRWGSGEEPDFPRPSCRVTPATGVRSDAIAARHVQRTQTLTVLAYPIVGIDAESSLIEADRVGRLILAAIAKGIDTAAWSRGRAHPLKVPLYDYSAVALREAVTESERIGWMSVTEAPNVEALPDPSEAGAFVVVADVRLSWVESIGVPDGDTLVQTVGARRAA